jgi:hypothetical protein
MSSSLLQKHVKLVITEARQACYYRSTSSLLLQKNVKLGITEARQAWYYRSTSSLPDFKSPAGHAKQQAAVTKDIQACRTLIAQQVSGGARREDQRRLSHH